MRDYSKVSGAFWTGETGKKLRANRDAQVVALYLMTCNHANMIGVFHCPLIYIAHEAGVSIEGASMALRSLSDASFCTYDEARETVWVHEMAKFQVDTALKIGDKRVAGIQKLFDSLSDGDLKRGFFERYAEAFHLVDNSASREAPSKPLRSQKQEQKQKQEQEQKSTGNLQPAEVCKALRAAGIASVNPSHPELCELVKAGATLDEFLACVEASKGKRSPFPYILKTVVGRRLDAAAIAANPGASPNGRPPTKADKLAATAANLGSARHDTGKGQTYEHA